MTSKMMLLPVVHCENCRRGNDEELGLDLYDTESIHFGYKFCFVKRCDLAERCTLCLSCSQFLLAARKEGFMMNNQFVWQCIVFDALQHSEDDFIWKLIPVSWRKWWLAFSNESIAVLRVVSMSFPEYAIVDGTDDHAIF